MIDTMIFLLSVVGFMALLLANPRHQRDWLRHKPAPKLCILLRRSGFLLLALALIVAAIGCGWGYGAIAWFGWLTVAAALVVSANTNRERIMGKARP